MTVDFVPQSPSATEDPLALLIPVKLEWVFSRRGGLRYKINSHELSLS